MNYSDQLQRNVAYKKWRKTLGYATTVGRTSRLQKSVDAV